MLLSSPGTAHDDRLLTAVNLSTRPRQEADFQRASSAGLGQLSALTGNWKSRPEAGCRHRRLYGHVVDELPYQTTARSCPQPLFSELLTSDAPGYHHVHANQDAAAQIATISAAPMMLTGLPPPEAKKTSAFPRHSRTTCGGSMRIASQINPGNSSTSSRYPITGMKSGIKSMGLRA